MVAVVVALMVTAISSVHFLLRPHLLTFAFVYLTFRACQTQHKDGGWAIAWVPVYTALLANFHGGFVALPVITATAGFGHAISGAWDTARSATWRSLSLRRWPVASRHWRIPMGSDSIAMSTISWFRVASRN